MKIYQVQSTNMDIQDGIFSNGYFMHKHHAEGILKSHASLHDGKNIVEDMEGKLETYDDQSLNYTIAHHKPAVYYRSHWGNYVMVVWISEVYVQE
jgi:hypothetical protein